MDGLVGYTGTVGKTLIDCRGLTEENCAFYNSSNIDQIDGKSFDTLYICGISANKWIANRYGDEDLKKIEGLISHLETVKAKKAVLISTVDVHSGDFYGNNRLAAERKILSIKDLHCKVLRLPGLIGKHIKKNLIYDLAHPEKDLKFTSVWSHFIFFNLEHISLYIDHLFNSEREILELTGEPMSVFEICLAVGVNPLRLNWNKKGSHYQTIRDDNAISVMTKKQQLKAIKDYVKVCRVTSK